MATVPLLQHTVAPALDLPGDVVFDLRGLSFMDSSGIHALYKIAKPLVEGSLILQAPQPIVERVIQITGVDGTGNIRLRVNGSAGRT
jgi:anti-anti-sigma factor